MYISKVGQRSGKEIIEESIELQGNIVDKESVPENIINNYIGKVPDILIDLWRNHGIGIIEDGAMRLCIPSDFDDLLEMIFQNDKDIEAKESYVVGHTLFGTLIIWNTKHWLIELDFLDYIAAARSLINEKDKTNDNIEIITKLFPLQPRDYLDSNNKGLLARAKKKLGLPKKGECYGFAPALVMGGEPTLDNLKIMPIHTHLSFLAQLQPFTLVDFFARPIQAVRLIGDDSDNNSSPTNTTNSSSKNKFKRSWFKRLFGR